MLSVLAELGALAQRTAHDVEWKAASASLFTDDPGYARRSTSAVAQTPRRLHRAAEGSAAQTVAAFLEAHLPALGLRAGAVCAARGARRRDDRATVRFSALARQGGRRRRRLCRFAVLVTELNVPPPLRCKYSLRRGGGCTVLHDARRVPQVVGAWYMLYVTGRRGSQCIHSLTRAPWTHRGPSAMSGCGTSKSTSPVQRYFFYFAGAISTVVRCCQA